MDSNSSIKKLSIIGCGSVAKTLAHLWHNTASVVIGDVVNRSLHSAEASTQFIGAGNTLDSLVDLQEVDSFLIGCQDDQIEDCLQQLLDTPAVKPGNIIFHCSGSKSSLVLNKAKEKGAFIASLHPVKSFASPELAIESFENTYCGLEGDDSAVSVLEDLVLAIGGHSFDIDPQQKLMYHAASVFACNYMVALQELSIQALAHSGVAPELAMKIMEPVVKGTADNIFSLGTANALTGPIARGDHHVVEAQLSAVDNWSKEAGELYRLLGSISTELSAQQGTASEADLEKIKEVLGKNLI